MSAPSPGPAGPPPSGTPEPRSTRRRTGLVAAAVLVGAGAVTAIALGAGSLWGGDPGDAAASPTVVPSATTTQESSLSPEPIDPAPTDQTVDHTVAPRQTWQVSAIDLMGGDPTAWVALAAPDPLGRPAVQDMVVVTVGAGDKAAVVGLDWATGDVRWWTELAGSTSVDCHVLGTGASTLCVATNDYLDGETYSVATFETSTGEPQGHDEITFKPAAVTELEGDIILAGSTVLTGALSMTRGTPTDIDAGWQVSSDSGYVPATAYEGGFLVSEGTGWSYVSGATMVVDLATGEAESMSAESGRSSAPWPGGTVLASTTAADGSVVVTATVPGTASFTAAGRAWSRLGSSDAMESFVGIGDTAYDPRSGAALWSVAADPTALSTNYTALDDVVLQQTWWEESVSLTAVDALTGAQRWTSGTRSAWLFSRAGDVLLADTSYGIEAVDLTSGEKSWSVDYTDLITGDSSMYRAAHSISGPSLVTTFDQTIAGYTFS